MPIDVQRFITPEQKFEGLYNLADRQEAKNLRQEQAKKDAEAKKYASDKYFTNYLDPKDRFTGTAYDPVTNKMLSDALNQAYDLSSKGVGDNEIFTAIAPLVNKVNEYSQKAKMYTERKKEALSLVDKESAIDKKALAAEMDRLAFYDDNGKLKDIGEFDPTLDYWDVAVQQNPDRVMTDFGVEDFAKSSPRQTKVEDFTVINSRGGREKRKVEVNATDWSVPEQENGVFTGKIVPKYDEALDDGEKIYHNFDDGKGGIVKAPVRLLDVETFNNTLKDPRIANWLRGQVSRSIKGYTDQNGEQLKMDSPQAEAVARALMYDALKTKTPGTYKHVQEQKETPIRIYNNSGGGSSKTAAPIDLTEYPDVEGNGKDITNLMQGVKVTGLPSGKTLLAEKVAYNPDTKKVTFTEYTSRNEQTGEMEGGRTQTVGLKTFLQNIKTNNPGTDMKFLEGLWNPVTGKQPKQEEPKQKEEQPKPKSWVNKIFGKSEKININDIPPGTKLEEKDGKYYYKGKEVTQ